MMPPTFGLLQSLSVSATPRQSFCDRAVLSRARSLLTKGQLYLTPQVRLPQGYSTTGV